MPATYDTEKWRTRNAWLPQVDHDPDSADGVVVALTTAADCLPITDGYRRFIARLTKTVGTGNVDEFAIIAATAADGTGAVVVKAHPFDSEADAVGDTVHLEVDVEQVREVLATATHVGVRVEFATSTDEARIDFIRAEPTFERTGLTPDVIA